MKSLIIATSFIFLIFFNATSQSTGFEWAMGITCSEEFSPSSVKTDSDGNIFMAGEFSGRADFNLGQESMSLESFGYDDIFISKFNSNGQLVWAKNVGGKYNDVCNYMTLDKNSNIYITGRFSSTVDFDPGEGNYELESNSGADIYIAKYDSSGVFLWAVRIGGEGWDDGDDEGTSIITDNDGNVLVTGWFQG
ncbi:MAG: hypothetical protein LC658_15145, partial [Bacteroidales bacterium]|nr:hypothetical protein [Bacteroidales bacterium]